MVFWKANHEHGITDLIHHVIDVIVLKVGLIYYEGPFDKLAAEREDVFEVFIESPDLTLMEFYFKVHQCIFLGDYVGNQVYITVRQG